jgi:signal transduction histidine kinase
MSTAVSFQTRARTIDHLGRGQIADSPTAVSELWKNAYDAYAKSVELHIFDGTPEVAAVFDDGFGMSRSDFIDRWLVIGTESKLEDDDRLPRETFGLPVRARQGEKGIGRLSAAFLAPVTIVVSKQEDSRFAAVMVDWRLFENPYISLSDIQLPVEEFDSPRDVLERLDSMVEVIRSNLGKANDARGMRLRDAWQRFSNYEQRQGAKVDTATAIVKFWRAQPLKERHLSEWPVFSELGEHGTALFLVGIHHELAVWVRPTAMDDEAELVKERLRETLTGFTDPYAENRVDFDYAVLLHQGNRAKQVLAAPDVFGRDDLHALEHYVDGQFDEAGVFRGRVVAFGQDLGIKEIIPRRAPPRTGRDRLGPFAFCIGTFEQDPLRTTHSEQSFTLLKEQAEKFGGIAVYRDGLRIMPYGRSDADFFGIEERRGKHQGRHFWAHRRSFGRMAFTHRENPNLRDKAGREGLVENRAKRELRILVINVLVEVAARYYGTDAELRQELMPGIMARNAAAREAAQKARTRRRRNIRIFLKEQASQLERALNEARILAADTERARKGKDLEQATLVLSRYKSLSGLKDELRPPPVPSKLGDLEERYREYRDSYRELIAGLDELAKLTVALEAEVGSLEPSEAARRSFYSNQSSLNSRIERYLKRIDTGLETLKDIWRGHAEEDRGTFYKMCHPLLEESINSSNLNRFLNIFDVHRRELEVSFSDRYEPVIRALDQLAEGIDLDSALSVVDDDMANLEDRVRHLNAVAQAGITVEIIGHELESLDAEVRRNLLRLPAEVRRSSAFRLAFEAQSALTDRLRFLSPLKIAGYRARQTISGEEIARYIEEFFGKTFQDNRIEFVATRAFRSMQITDLPSRIYPVFINLVNNAVFWVSQRVQRQIQLDLVDDLVIVADSGPGVDPDDVPRLFELFFTRRHAGRGVGLYLTQANLAVAHHRIRYATDADPKVLPGANFVIDFRGIVTNA